MSSGYDFSQKSRRQRKEGYEFSALRDSVTVMTHAHCSVIGNLVLGVESKGPYSNAIHNNHELNNMSYLKGLLTCNAARAISGLPMTSQNYDKAIEMLKERFGRKQVLINVHMESLSKISAPQLMCSNCEKLKIAGRATFVP